MSFVPEWLARWWRSLRFRSDRILIREARSRWPKVDNSLDSIERNRRETGQR
jgi:hypothetical protein